MSPNEGEEWSIAEIVRGIRRIEEFLKEQSDHYVTRELHNAQLKAMETRVDELAKWQTDTAASLERTNRAQDNYVKTSTARWVVGLMVPILVGLMTAVIMLIVA